MLTFEYEPSKSWLSLSRLKVKHPDYSGTLTVSEPFNKGNVRITWKDGDIEKDYSVTSDLFSKDLFKEAAKGLIQWLSENKGELITAYNTALLWAISEVDIAMVKWLLETKLSSIDEQITNEFSVIPEQALLIAGQRAKNHIIWEIAKKYHRLNNCMWDGDPDLFRYLLNRGGHLFPELKVNGEYVQFNEDEAKLLIFHYAGLTAIQDGFFLSDLDSGIFDLNTARSEVIYIILRSVFIYQKKIFRTEYDKEILVSLVSWLEIRWLKVLLDEVCKQENIDSALWVEAIKSMPQDKTQHSAFLFEYILSCMTPPQKQSLRSYLKIESNDDESVKDSEKNKNNNKANEKIDLKTQSFADSGSGTMGLPELSSMSPTVLVASYKLCYRDAVYEYRQQRENGLPQDKPNRLFPEDGTLSWVEKENCYHLRYTEGPRDKAWMEEKDRNFLNRIEREKKANLKKVEEKLNETDEIDEADENESENDETIVQEKVKISDTSIEHVSINQQATIASQQIHTIPEPKPDPIIEYLTQLYQRKLNTSQTIDIHCNFNKITGASDELWRVVLREIEFYYRISMVSCESDPTIVFLAENIREKLKKSKLAKLLHKALNQEASLFFIHPIMGDSSHFRQLKSSLSNTQLDALHVSVYAISSPVREPEKVPDYEKFCSMKFQAEAVINAMRSVQLHGPYYLCGWSYGGVLAIEVARQLIRQREKVHYLGLIDSQQPQTFQQLTLKHLRTRLLMHINFISYEMLKVGLPNDKILNEEDIEFSSGQNELIRQAFAVTVARLEQYSINNCVLLQDSRHTLHKNFPRLKSYLNSLQANYLAMASYYPEALISDSKLPTATVYVASDAPAILLRVPEYLRGDINNLLQMKARESTVKDSDHFDIVTKPEFANLLMKHISHVKDELLSHKLFKILVDYYHAHIFSQVNFWHDEKSLPVTQFNMRLPLSDCFNEGKHVLVRGPAGIGKSILAKQLVMHWLNGSQKLWQDKRWVFYINLQDLLVNTIPNDENAMATFLWHLYFKASGRSLQEAIRFWNYIRKQPNTIVFILDGFDKVNDNQDITLPLKALMMQRVCVIAMSQDYYQLSELRQLNFSAIATHQLLPFDQEQIQGFVSEYFHTEAEKSKRFTAWLNTLPERDLTKHPANLAMLCSLWNSCCSYSSASSLEDLIKLSVILKLRAHSNLSQETLNIKSLAIIDILRTTAFQCLLSSRSGVTSEKIKATFAADDPELIIFNLILSTGFLMASSNDNQTRMRSYHFRSPIILLYFACQYALFASIDEQMQFIKSALQTFDVNFIRLWFINLLEGETVKSILSCFAAKPANYTLTNVCFETFFIERAHVLGISMTDIPNQIEERINKIVATFSAPLSAAEKTESVLTTHQSLIQELKETCPNTFAVREDEPSERASQKRMNFIQRVAKEADSDLTTMYLQHVKTIPPDISKNASVAASSKAHFFQGAKFIAKEQFARKIDELYNAWPEKYPDIGRDRFIRVLKEVVRNSCTFNSSLPGITNDITLNIMMLEDIISQLHPTAELFELMQLEMTVPSQRLLLN